MIEIKLTCGSAPLEKVSRFFQQSKLRNNLPILDTKTIYDLN